MKILAIEKKIEGINSSEFVLHAKEEAKRVWELYKCGVIRESYFRNDKDEAVLILECENESEALKFLSSLPLVKNGLIEFEVIPLKAYPGFERLFQR
jgi:hypothetical protein